MLIPICIVVAIIVALYLVNRLLMPRRLARGIRAVRRIAEWQERHRSVAPDDALPPDEQRQIDAALGALTGAGARLLGNVVELTPDGRAAGISHWFAADTGRSCGWVGMVGLGAIRRLGGALFSQSGDGRFAATRWGAEGAGFLAAPPEVHRLAVPSKLTITDVLSRHRELAAGLGAAPLVEVRDLEGAVRMREDLKEVQRAWRRAQPTQVLLEADVRSYLPGKAAVYVPRVITLLAQQPAATDAEIQVPARAAPSSIWWLALPTGIIGVAVVLVIVSYLRHDILPLATYKVTQGTIDSARLETRRASKGIAWVPRAFFRYSVDGRNYGGTRVTPSDQGGSRSWATTLLAPYHKGAGVPVHYDPTAPERAYLQGAPNRAWMMIGFGIAYLAFSGWILARAIRANRPTS